MTEPAELATARGWVKRQGPTVYQYGSHVLRGRSGQTLLALRSDRVDLDRYLNRQGTVTGAREPGLPYGPACLEVVEAQITADEA